MRKKRNINTAQCRTCLNSTKGWKSLAKLTDKKQQISYGEMLKEVIRINVMDKQYNKMPQLICDSCCRQLKIAHNFIQQAQEANDKLWNMLNGQNVDKEIDTNRFRQETQIDLDIKQEHEKMEESLEFKFEDNVESPKEIPSLTSICDKNSELNLENSPVYLLSNVNKENAIEIKPIEINADIYKPNSEMSDTDDDAAESFQSDDSDSNGDDENLTDQFKDDPETDIAIPCEICNKIFVNSKALATHRRISHIPEEQKCACTICDKKFTRYCNMYKHMRVFHGDDTVTLIRKPAEGDNLHECDKCPKKYSRKKSLNTHMRRKHSNRENSQENEETKKPLKETKKPADKFSLCPICGSSFTSKTQLTVHIRRHTGERPFKCDVCDRAFLLSTHLTSHKRLHTGEKPFKCKLCAKAFRVSSKLAQHMRSHSDARPYKCSHCERSFKYSQDLNIHTRSHTGEKPYVCSVCGSAYQRYNTLRDHMQRMGHRADAVQMENDFMDNIST